MIPLRTPRRPYSVPAVVLLGAFVALGACRGDTDAATTSRADSSDASRVGPVVDRELATHQVELLDLAFAAASAMPLNPHTKNRARAQQSVVDALFEVGQPRRAVERAGQIANWRRGAGFAQFARVCAEHGQTNEAQQWIAKAQAVADELLTDPDAQEWRRDHIMVRIATAQMLLGEVDQANASAAHVGDVEAGVLDQYRAERIERADVGIQLAAIDHAFAAGTLELVRSGLAACVTLHRRFYDDAELRPELERRVRSSYAKLPVDIRIRMMIGLVENALARHDEPAAQRLVGEVETLVADSRWLPEDHVPMRARIAALRSRAGEADAARTLLDAAIAEYDEVEPRIVDIYRANALRPLAEAADAIGDRTRALALFARALDAGVHNPNSRPRAEDLVATCISLAINDVEPTPELMARIRAIRDGLGNPW